MKQLIICAATLIVYCCSYSQNPLFIRVYGANRHLIAKGYLCNSTDSTAAICRHPGSTPLMVDVKNIWVIKTKHTAAHSLLVGTTVGLAAGAVVGLATPNKPGGYLVFDRGFYTALGALAGVGYGSFFGTVAMLFRHSKTFVIKGDISSWQQARQAIISIEQGR